MTSRNTTFNARVGSLNIRSEVSRTRLHAVESGIWNYEMTGATTGAACVQDVSDVGRTAEMTVATSDAASELHSSVTSLIDHQHLSVTTRRVERLHVTKFRRHCTSYHIHHHTLESGFDF